MVQKVYTPVTTAFKTNNVNVFVNTVVIIKSVKECDAFVQAIVYVVNSGASSMRTSSLCVCSTCASGEILLDPDQVQAM